MLSFLEYRRKNLQNNLLNLNSKDFVELNLNIFKGDLLECIKLPNLLFESSILFESSYDDARKQDYKENKEIFEFLLQNTKNEIIQIIAEAESEIGSDPASDKQKAMLRAHGYQANATGSGHKALTDEELDGLTKSQASKLLNNLNKDFPLIGKNSEQFLKNLEVSIRRSIGGLKNSLSSVLSQTRPIGDEEIGNENPPLVGTVGSSRPEAGGRQFSSPSSSQPEPPPVPRMGNSAVPPTGSFSSNQSQKQQTEPVAPKSGSTGSKVSLDEPSEDDSFTPAPRGSWKPADGWWPGIKRAIVNPVGGWLKNKWQGLGNAWKTFRRRWHNDKLREHENFLENLFLENENQVMKAIDDFTDNLIKNINQRFKYYIANIHGKQLGNAETEDQTKSTTAAVEPRSASKTVGEPIDYQDEPSEDEPRVAEWNKESLSKVLEELFPEEYKDGKVVFDDKSYIQIKPRAIAVDVKGSSVVRNKLLEKISKQRWFRADHSDEVSRKRNGELTKDSQNYILNLFGINTFSANAFRINHILQNYERVKNGIELDSSTSSSKASPSTPQTKSASQTQSPTVDKDSGLPEKLHNSLKEKGLLETFKAWKQSLDNWHELEDHLNDDAAIEHIIKLVEEFKNKSKTPVAPQKDNNTSVDKDSGLPEKLHNSLKEKGLLETFKAWKQSLDNWHELEDHLNDDAAIEHIIKLVEEFKNKSKTPVNSSSEQDILTIKDLDSEQRKEFVEWKQQDEGRRSVKNYLEEKFQEAADDYMKLRDYIWIESKISGLVYDTVKKHLEEKESDLIKEQASFEDFLNFIKELIDKFKKFKETKSKSITSIKTSRDSRDSSDRGSDLEDEENIDSSEDEENIDSSEDEENIDSSEDEENIDWQDDEEYQDDE